MSLSSRLNPKFRKIYSWFVYISYVLLIVGGIPILFFVPRGLVVLGGAFIFLTISFLVICPDEMDEFAGDPPPE